MNGSQIHFRCNYGAGGFDGRNFQQQPHRRRGGMDMGNRIGDVNRRIDDMRDLLRAEMSKNHSEMLHRLADLDTRLTRVEQRIERVL